MHARIGLLGCAMLTFSIPLNASEALSMRLRPSVAMSPATIIVLVTVDNDGANRSLEVIADSEDFFRSSEVQLDGTSARRVNVFEFRDLPPGMYEVSGRLTRNDGSRLAVSNQLKVVYGGRPGR